MPPSPSKKQAAKKLPAKKLAAPRINGDLPPQILPIGAGSASYLRMLIYGEPGTWKTITVGTAPNALFLEGDLGGDISAARRGSTAKKWPVKDWDDAYAALGWLEQGGAQQFEFLVLDSISMFQSGGLAQIMDDLVANPKTAHRKVWQVDRGEYGQNMAMLLRYLQDLCKLPINLLCTAHIQEDTDHEGESRFMPQVQGKSMPDKVCAYFSLVAHMQVKVIEGSEHPVLSTQKDGKFYTKDRYGVIGKMVDPTVPKIMARIEGSAPPPRKAAAAAKKVGAPVKKLAPKR
jgi:hypothetical protein